MPSKEILKYYEQSASREVRDDLVFSIGLLQNEKVVIDCGCGAGANIVYLRSKGFTVYAFDIEPSSITLCENRFEGDQQVILSLSSFSAFDYPKSNLVLADASLFFCPASDFAGVWEKIYKSLDVDGIFCGSFLGPNDTMASPDYDSSVYWSDVLVFTECSLRAALKGFEVLKFTEHNESGEPPEGDPHQWHIYSVVARKLV